MALQLSPVDRCGYLFVSIHTVGRGGDTLIFIPAYISIFFIIYLFVLFCCCFFFLFVFYFYSYFFFFNDRNVDWTFTHTWVLAGSVERNERPPTVVRFGPSVHQQNGKIKNLTKEKKNFTTIKKKWFSSLFLLKSRDQLANNHRNLNDYTFDEPTVIV